ncbi:hypothetical protein KR51_00010640, partial [Rubidibacter lacunae KORDI 51-2]
MLSTLSSRLGDWNPQLLRELQTHLRSRHLVFAAASSLVVQILFYLYGENLLITYRPGYAGSINRYCRPINLKAHIVPQHPDHCLDAAGNFVTNYELWWLDLFVAGCVIGSIAAIGIGVYAIVNDIAREERRGTLDLVRLSPQSATGFFIGKLLGVPAGLYACLLLSLPLHLYAGLAARIPLLSILGFYATTIVAFAFFFTGALLLGLSGQLGSHFRAWAGSTIVIFFLAIASLFHASSYLTDSPFDWLPLFSPTAVLPYLVGKTPHSLDTIGSFHIKDAAQLNWYGQEWWATGTGAIAFSVIR